MAALRFTQVHPAGDEVALRDWRRIHNAVILADPLSAVEVASAPGATSWKSPTSTALRLAARPCARRPGKTRRQR
jgi:hypothetical protein